MDLMESGGKACLEGIPTEQRLPRLQNEARVRDVDEKDVRLLFDTDGNVTCGLSTWPVPSKAKTSSSQTPAPRMQVKAHDEDGMCSTGTHFG